LVTSKRLKGGGPPVNRPLQRRRNLPRKSRHFQLTLGGVEWGKPGLKKVQSYSVEFTLTTVKLSRMPGVEVQTVAHALDIPPLMLSRWRNVVRDGALKGWARTQRRAIALGDRLLFTGPYEARGT
jgi:transposase